ncbi:MAG TPA: SH3 domain-containing protein, partial [Terriglobales bacterium]|nr:SH3 domain-containing protein [Terriglobales bacterium]
MKTNQKSRILNATLVLAMAALACNAPSSAATPTFTPEAAAATTTFTPAPTLDPAAGQCIATASQDANMRTGPGTDWPVVSQITGGNSAQVTGHNGDKSWWQLNGSTWVSASLTTLSGNCDGLLVVGFPPPPTKKAGGDQGGSSSSSSSSSSQPTVAPPPIPPAANVAFEVDYSITWFCGNDWRVSFVLYDQGNVNIESVYYSVEAPAGTYQNAGTINNAPFETTAKESQPACAQPVPHGQSSLAPGQNRFVPI